ncbi:8-amino-7-oxononanoate synthase bioF1 [Mycobacterium tuberculosis GM 1503]|nr:8-amino-7-oxononanoate synthase bioF1 [Mycobacterium tuberculosis GM 1503]
MVGRGAAAAPRGRTAALPAAASRGRHRAGLGLQRLSRSVPTSRRHRRRRPGAADLGRRRHRVAPGYRRHQAAPAIRGRARRVRRRCRGIAALLWLHGNLGAVDGLSGLGSLMDPTPVPMSRGGCLSAVARRRLWVTPHRDVDAVDAALRSRDEQRGVVVTDSVFSADGSLAPVRELLEVCRGHGALLLVDEAHGLGVRGGGRGLLYELGLAGAPDVVMTTTLSKALGSQGGVVLGPTPVRAHLIDAARPFIFDTGLAPAAVGAARAALRVLQAEPWRPQAVLNHAGELARMCGVAAVPDSAMVSVILGEPESAVAAAAACLDAGVKVGCFRPPTVPAGTSRLRLTARASLNAGELELARRVLTDVLAVARR